MNCEISKELQIVLLKLCKELNLFLNKTESSLFLAREKFIQVENVLKKWELSNNYGDLGQEKCICKTLSNIQISANNEESNLLTTISKTLHNAELIRKKSVKANASLSKISSGTNSIAKNKIKNKPVEKCTSLQNNVNHGPCCPLYITNHELVVKQTLLKLSDAITFHKIPPVLTQTIKHSNKILSCCEKTRNSYKNMFFQDLEAQIDEHCSLQQKNDSSIGTFLMYLSSLNSYEKKRKTVNRDTWIFYKNIQSLKTFHSLRVDIITKESWIIIFNLIVNELIPVLQECALVQKQKLHLFKILKTICNCAYLNVPTVPIFNIQIKACS